MPYFAPSIPPYKLTHLLEREAQRFRAHLGVGPDEPVDAFEVADWFGMEVRYPDELCCLPDATRAALVQQSRTEWSGMTFHLPNGIIVTVLNPAHSPRRWQATLMEEVAHVYLGHAPSTIVMDPLSSLLTRTCDKRAEMEAYRFGSAMLVPKCGLIALYKQGYRPMDIANHYGVSYDLVTFRTNLCKLRRLAG
jgi:hypothetical protein